MGMLNTMVKHHFLYHWNKNKDLITREQLLLSFLRKHFPTNNHFDLKNVFQSAELNLLLTQLLTEYFVNTNIRQTECFVPISVSLYKVFLHWDKTLFYYWKQLAIDPDKLKDIIRFLMNSGNHGWKSIKYGFESSDDVLPYLEHITDCFFTRAYTKFDDNLSCIKHFFDSYQIDKGFYVMDFLIKNNYGPELSEWILVQQNKHLEQVKESLKQQESILLDVVLS